MRKWLLVGLVAFGLGSVIVLYVDRQQKERERETIDATIAAELKQPIEVHLRTIAEKDPFFAIAGKFKSWRPEGHSRLPYIDWNHSYLLISGTAKFENADVRVAVSVFRGNLDVKSQPQTQAQWLAEHPEQGVAIVNRRIIVSERFAKNPPNTSSADETQVAADEESPPDAPSLILASPMASEGYPGIDLEARHPAATDK